MSFRDSVVKGLLWSATQTWGSRLISVTVFIVLARLIEPKAFGLVALASVFTGIINIFLDGGFSEAIVQRRDLEKPHLDTAFWIAVGVGTMFTFGGWLTAPLVAGWFNEPLLTPILQWLSFTFLIGSLSITQQAILQRNLVFKRLALVSLVAALVGGTAALVAAFMGFGVWSLVVQSLSTRATMAVLLWSVSEWRPGLRFSWQHGRQLFHFGVNVAGAHLLLVFDRHALDLVIGSFLGPVALGYFTLANRIVRELTRALVTTGKAVTYPVLARLQTSSEDMRNGFYAANQYTSLVVFPVFVGLAITAPLIVPVCCGPKWNASIPVLQILALVGLVRSANISGYWLKAVGRPGLNFWIMLAQALGSFVVVLLMVHQGLVAVAAGYLAVNLLLWPFWFYAIHCVVPLGLGATLRPFAGPFGASVGMVLLLVLIEQLLPEALPEALQLSVCVACGIVSYPLFLYLMAPSLTAQMLALVQPRLSKPPA